MKRLSEAYVRELEERLRLACQPCAECGHVDWRELDDILGTDPVVRTFTGGADVIPREPRDELRMTLAELDASVAAFCDEAERDAFEARNALLDTPDIEAGTLHYTEQWALNSDRVLGTCPHGVDLDREFCPKGCRV